MTVGTQSDRLPAPTTCDHARDVRLWEMVRALHAHVEHRVGEVLRRHGLGLSEFHALKELAGTEKDRMRMQDLAEAIGLNQSSVTRLVGRLQRAGWADIAPCPADGRGVFALLTDAGRARWHQAGPEYISAVSAALDDAGGTIPGAAGALPRLRGHAGPQGGDQ